MKLIEAVGIRIENLIKENGLTIYSLTKKAGMPRPTIWKVIHHDPTLVKTVKLDTVYQIAATLDMTLTQFFDDPIFAEVDD